MPSSRCRACTAAAADTPTVSAADTRMSVNSSGLFWSSASAIARATPFLLHISSRLRAGTPSWLGGNATRWGTCDEPVVMSTSSPVACWMRSATRRIRSRLAASMPVTPDTRTRTALTGAADATSPPAEVNIGSAAMGTRIDGGVCA